MAGMILFEDEEFILADFSDNFRIDLRLVLKKEYRSARIYAFVYDDRNAFVRLELSSKHYFQRINYTRIINITDYNDLRHKLLNIKTPKDFIINFIKLISPQMAKVIRGG